MMINKQKYLVFVLLLVASIVCANDEQTQTFDVASGSVARQLADSLAELSQLREQMASEKVPLSRKLSDLEAELINVRSEYQQTTRLLDSRTLDLSNLRTEIKQRKDEAAYVSNLLGDYIRNFESRLHIAEIQLYNQPLEEAKLAAENSNLSEQEVYLAQAKILEVSLDRLSDSLGGMRFNGTAVDSGGLIKNGTFVMIGPTALFRSEDGMSIGTAEQRLGSLEPAVIAFSDPMDTASAAQVVAEGKGIMPMDPTLGSAHKIEEIKPTVMDEIQKGGVVMYPIFGLASAALLVALFKLLCIVFTRLRSPSQRRVRKLLAFIADRDEEGALKNAKQIGGPVGRMLQAGVEHIKEPRELIEEVMYEKMMAARIKLEGLLPFVAISAASAPLLGLLGTVTGIINTFALITVFGSGDVKSLSGGISEALITTKYGLIVAIPSLLIHAFLSRMARGVVNQMEKSAVALVNQVSKTPFVTENKSTAAVTLTSEQVGQLQEFLLKIGSQEITIDANAPQHYRQDVVGGCMDKQVLSINRSSTVSEAIHTIRSCKMGLNTDAVFVVDEHGKYVGQILMRHLLSRPDDMPVATLTDQNPFYVRVDTHCDEVKNLLRDSSATSVPVLDHEDRLVGQVTRNGD